MRLGTSRSRLDTTSQSGQKRKLQMFLSSLFLLTLILGLFAPGFGAVNEGRALLEVNCAQSGGELSPYIFGTTSGPFYDAQGLALCKEAGFQLIEVLRDMSARTAAPATGPPPMGPGPGRPPMPPFGGPPGGGVSPFPPPPPSSLNQDRGPWSSRPPNTFNEVKRQVDECLRLGMEVMVAFMMLEPPRNEAAFQKQVAGEVKELQQIAARHRTRIKLFRFGCEPDNPAWWRGTAQQFFTTYKLWVQALKSVDSGAIVVAPGIAAPLASPGANSPSQIIKDFLHYCQQERLPLDILAIHGYGFDPQFTFGLAIKVDGEYLQRYPRLSPVFGVPKIANNEWNMPAERQFPILASAWAATHNVAALIQMIKNGVQLAVRYGGCTVLPREMKLPREREESQFILVYPDHTKKPTYYAMAGINRFANFPYQVRSRSNNGNFEISAGLTKAKNKLYIAVCNLPVLHLLEIWKKLDRTNPTEEQYIRQQEARTPECSQYALKITNLPISFRGKVRLRRYRVDERINGSLVEDRQLTWKHNFDIIQNLPGPGIDFILLEAAK
jgi:hypothetical protein